MFKLSFHVRQCAGRIGYIRREDSGLDSLIVRSFEVVPSGHYPDYPPDRRDYTGSCVQLYDDGGRLGGFGELEYHTPSIVCRSGESITDRSTVWHYTGEPSDIARISEALLGQSII